MHLRMEFDSGVGPTCRFYKVLSFFCGDILLLATLYIFVNLQKKICFPFLGSVTSALHISVTKYYLKRAGGIALSINMSISFVALLTMEIYSKH